MQIHAEGTVLWVGSGGYAPKLMWSPECGICQMNQRKPLMSLRDCSEPLSCLCCADGASALTAFPRCFSTSLSTEAYLRGPVFHGYHCGRSKSPKEAGGMGQSPLLGKALRPEQGLFSAGSEQRLGIKWGDS